jgi:hypothetical protein
VPRHFGYDPRSHHGGHFPRRHGFPAGGSYTHLESRHLDDPCFLRHGSRPTGQKGGGVPKVVKTMKTSSSRMVKCWISKIYLTNPSTKTSIFSCPM